MNSHKKESLKMKDYFNVDINIENKKNNDIENKIKECFGIDNKIKKT
jgi:hypothetical protein